MMTILHHRDRHPSGKQASGCLKSAPEPVELGIGDRHRVVRHRVAAIGHFRAKGREGFDPQPLQARVFRGEIWFMA